MSAAIDAAKSGWPEKVRRIKELENLKRDLEKYRDSFNAMNNLRKELAWSYVRSKESQARSLEVGLNTSRTQLEEAISQIEQLESRLEYFTKNRASLIQRQGECRELVSVAQARAKESDTKVKKIQSDINLVTSEMTEMNKEMQELRRRESELQKMAANGVESESLEIKALQESRQRINDEIEQVNQEISRNAKTREEAITKSKELIAKMSSLRASRTELNMAVNGLSSQKLRLEQSQSNKLNMFSDKMSDFVKIMESKASSFHRIPVGPVGLYVELKLGADKWAVAIEALIGRELDSFIVHNHHDRSILQDLFKSVSPNQYPGIMVLNFDRDVGFDIDAARASTKRLNKDSILAVDAIAINSPSVSKALIINNGIERALLIDNREHAINIMSSHPRPQMIDVIFTPLHQIRASQNSVSCFPIRSGQNSLIIKSGNSAVRYIFEALISRNMEAEISAKQDQVRSLDEMVLALERDIAKNEKISTCTNDVTSGLQKRLAVLKSQLEQVIDEIKFNSAGSSTAAEDLLRTSEKLSLLRKQFETAAERKQELSIYLNEAKSAQRVANTECEKADSELENLSIECAKLNSDRKMSDDQLILAKNSIIRIRKEAEVLQNLFEETLQVAREMRAEAEKFGQEVFSDRCPTVIDAELTQVTARLAEAQKRNIDPIRVNMDLKEQQESYERSRNEVLEGELLLNDMRHGLDKRERVMEGFRKNISQDSLVEFIVLLSARGFSGSLEYNHDMKELHLNIRTDGDQRKGESSRDIKQLSGGEKSFGTTCFLLSLWGSIGAPLRCLDEFDVFMDAINRRIVMDMIVEHARQRNFQFILITPIPLNDFLASNPDIHVVRMREPEKRAVIE